MEEHKFQPKEWVLGRQHDGGTWELDIFAYKSDDGYDCISGCYEQCLPYEGNEHLLGTKDAPVEWKVGDKVEVYEVWSKKWYDGKIVGIDAAKMKDDGFGFKVESECFDRTDGWKWCKADQLRKPEGKSEWRPKEGEFVEVLREGEWKSGKVLEDDHSSVPFYVRIEDGETRWFTECKVRPAKKKEPDEPYKFGDKVQVREDGEWKDGLFVMNDDGIMPYLVYLPEENDTEWVCEEGIRRA